MTRFLVVLAKNKCKNNYNSNYNSNYRFLRNGEQKSNGKGGSKFDHFQTPCCRPWNRGEFRAGVISFRSIWG
jgi:hypothetical protein